MPEPRQQKKYGNLRYDSTCTPEGTRQASETGVKSIEHGMLLSRETLEMLKEHDVWLSTQPLVDDEDRMVFQTQSSTEEWLEATAGTEKVYPLTNKMGVKIAFGTNALMDPEMADKQGKLLSKLTRWFTPHEALKMTTSGNAELVEMEGPRHPYREGPLGEITLSAYTDLILVNGNPLDGLSLIADPEHNFDLIIEAGKIYKNTLYTKEYRICRRNLLCNQADHESCPECVPG